MIASLISKFNEELRNKNTNIRLLFFTTHDNKICVRLDTTPDEFIEEVSIKPTDEFYALMERFFYSFGVEVDYNRDKTFILSNKY